MARKVFISFLGTGNYNPCVYEKNGFHSDQVLYIQEATLDYLGCKTDWTPSDACYILLTPKAEAAHWGDTYTNPFNGQVRPNEGLGIRLGKMNLPMPVTPVRGLPENGSEDAIWSIFSTMFSLVQDEDELYIDITHAFRYLPMLMLVFTSYSHFLKATQIKSITYGNWDARVEREMNGVKSDVAPIVDLLPLASIQDWAYAAGQYVHGGNTKWLLHLSGNALSPMLRGNDNKARKDANNVRKTIKYLDDYVKMLRTCRGGDIYQAKLITNLIRTADQVDDAIIAPLIPIFEKITEFARKGNTEPSYMNIFDAVDWCIEKGLNQQAVTLLKEGINTKLCIDNGLDWTNLDNRNLIASQLHHTKESADTKKQTAETNRKPNIFEEWAMLDDIIGQTRNDYNHGGMRRGSKEFDFFENEVKELNEKAKLILAKGAATYQEEVFINLTNHPSDKWDEAQVKAAQAYGDIVDLPFPNIDPDADAKEIKDMAEEYCQKVIEAAKDREPIVLLMGEMNFTYALLKRLRSQSIICLATTTQRISTDLPDGTKQSTFKFVKFRLYE